MTNFIYIKRVKNIIFHIFSLQLQTAKVMLKKKMNYIVSVSAIITFPGTIDHARH